MDDVKTFSNSEKALFTLKKELSLMNQLPVNIKMPILDTCSCIAESSYLKPIIKEKNIKIFILTSSIASEDKMKVENNPDIKGYLTKPISLDDLLKITS